MKSWGAPYLVALGPMYLLTYGSAIDPDITPVNVGWDRFLTEVWGDPGSLVCLLLYGVATVLTAFVAWRIVVVLTAGDRGAIGLHALALLTSALAGVVYLSAIRILAPWLSLGFAVDR
ncbi:MAG: hypothetical protein GTN78_02590 [Gemmatimonadales bacterium]|nr:hypothetical protein [Gemmatimonadales bacterium]